MFYLPGTETSLNIEVAGKHFTYQCIIFSFFKSAFFAEIADKQFTCQAKKDSPEIEVTNRHFTCQCTIFAVFSKKHVKNRSLTGKLPVSKKRLNRFFLIPDRCFARQSSIFNIIYMHLKGVLPVSEIFYCH